MVSPLVMTVGVLRSSASAEPIWNFRHLKSLGQKKPQHQRGTGGLTMATKRVCDRYGGAITPEDYCSRAVRENEPPAK